MTTKLARAARAMQAKSAQVKSPARYEHWRRIGALGGRKPTCLIYGTDKLCGECKRCKNRIAVQRSRATKSTRLRWTMRKAAIRASVEKIEKAQVYDVFVLRHDEIKRATTKFAETDSRYYPRIWVTYQDGKRDTVSIDNIFAATQDNVKRVEKIRALREKIDSLNSEIDAIEGQLEKVKK